MRRHHARGMLVGVALTVLLTGCHVKKPYEPTPPSEAAKSLEQLELLPSLEDTKSQVQTAVNEVTTAAGEIIPGITWRKFDEGASSECSHPYEQSGGQSFYLPDTVAVRAAVSEEQWTQILQAAKDAAAKLNATEIQVFQDRPGKHDVRFYGPAGLSIRLGYAGNLNVGGFTGCRLPAAKK